MLQMAKKWSSSAMRGEEAIDREYVTDIWRLYGQIHELINADKMVTVKSSDDQTNSLGDQNAADMKQLYGSLKVKGG